MILENYIKEVLLFERNFSDFFKKPFDYDLVIADFDKTSLKQIFKGLFNIDELRSEIEKVVISDKEYRGKDLEDVAYSNIMTSKRWPLLVLKKNNKVIQLLEHLHNFNFSNCNLKDNKPILCVPPQAGDLPEKLFGNPFGFDKEEQIKNQVLSLKNQMNWMIHDIHHSESDKDGVRRHNIEKIAGKSRVLLNNYITSVYRFFKRIGFTPELGEDDVWSSIYSYCLTEMSSKEDADSIDFDNIGSYSHLSDDDLRDFFKECYENVHKNSTLSRFESEIENHKLQDGFIYILAWI